MTSIPAYSADNIFAKIIRGEAPSVKIFEDEAALAFMDIFPQTEGHALVAPKRLGAVSLLDVREDDLQTLILAVQRLARATEKALRPDGVRVMQFNGAEAGQTVFHLHFHVIPVWAGRPMRRAHGHGEPADPAKLKELADRIAAAL
ncbi:MAG: HIT family protein [Parvularculaceae bacterium]|nr:HIT family protein [Parvularculaceae bacterium]